jgi:hypothetical protein
LISESGAGADLFIPNQETITCQLKVPDEDMDLIYAADHSSRAAEISFPFHTGYGNSY